MNGFDESDICRIAEVRRGPRGRAWLEPGAARLGWSKMDHFEEHEVGWFEVGCVGRRGLEGLRHSIAR